MVRGDGGGEQKRGRKRVKNNSESAKKRRERSRITSAASFQGLPRDLGYGSPAQKAARKLARELYGKGVHGLAVGRQIREMLAGARGEYREEYRGSVYHKSRPSLLGQVYPEPEFSTPV